MDDKPEFGRFIPLLGLGTEQPPPKPLSFTCRNGTTFITNAPAIHDPESTRINNHPTQSLPESRAAAHEPVVPAANTSADGDLGRLNGGDTTNDEEWYLEDLDALERASRPSAPAHISSTSKSQNVSQITVQDPVHDRSPVTAEDPLASDGGVAPAPVVDHHQALLRASTPSPGDDAGMARFLGERKRVRAKKQQQVAKRALRKGIAGKEVSGVPPKSTFLQQDLEKNATAPSTTTQKVASTSVPGGSEKKKLRDELKARATAGDEHAIMQLENLRASERVSGRVYQQRRRSKAADGDAEAISELQKQRDYQKNWRESLRDRASEGDQDAAARMQKQREQIEAWRKDMRAKASAGDVEAVAQIAKQREQNKARQTRLQQQALAGDANAILTLETVRAEASLAGATSWASARGRLKFQDEAVIWCGVWVCFGLVMMERLLMGTQKGASSDRC